MLTEIIYFIIGALVFTFVAALVLFKKAAFFKRLVGFLALFLGGTAFLFLSKAVSGASVSLGTWIAIFGLQAMGIGFFLFWIWLAAMVFRKIRKE